MVIELNIIDRSLIAFFSFYVAYTIADHPVLPFYLNDDFISLMAILSLYFPFRAISKRYPGYLSNVIRLMAVIEIFLALFQLVTGFNDDKPVTGHLTGTFRNSGVFEIFLSCCLPLFLSGFNDGKKTLLSKWTCKSMVVIIVLLTLINSSRTGLLLIIIVCFYVNRLAISFLWQRYVKTSMLIRLLLCLLSVGGIVTLWFYKFESSVGRLLIWKISFEMLLKKPLLGYGVSGFEKHYLYYQADYFKTHPGTNPFYKYAATDVVNPFNEYMMILVSFGLAGMGILLYFIYKIYKKYKKHRIYNENYYALILLLILVSSAFYYSFHVTMILALAVMALAEIAVSIPSETINFFKYTSIVKYAASLVSALFFMGCLAYCLTQYRATVIWREANDAGEQNFSLKLFQIANPELRHRSNFLYNYGARLFQAGQYEQCIQVLEECRRIQPSVDLLLYLGKAYQMRGNMSRAELCFMDASYMVPVRFVPKYFLVQLYMKNGAKDKAFSVAKEILLMPVKVSSPEVNNIQNEMARLLNRYKKTVK